MTVREVWEELEAAVVQRKSLFHTPVVATFDGKVPSARTVVLRGVNQAERTLRFHTDRRSSKVRALDKFPALAWHFYDHREKLQIRCVSTAHVLFEGPVWEEAWSQTQLLSRRCYLSEVAPGSVVAEAYPGFPCELVGREPTLEESEPGKENFCCVVGVVSKIEILSLRFEGHERVLFEWDEVAWRESWLAP
ncbi:MAG: pyridoxamine 5'-phosphate oxidase family protein [Fimbriimonadaceae bacterium]|nr:pyridoxamine 5'-phosphate oxidase family protein [Fimbriimonadaceae bacterium]